MKKRRTVLQTLKLIKAAQSIGADEAAADDMVAVNNRYKIEIHLGVCPDDGLHGTLADAAGDGFHGVESEITKVEMAILLAERLKHSKTPEGEIDKAVKTLYGLIAQLRDHHRHMFEARAAEVTEQLATGKKPRRKSNSKLFVLVASDDGFSHRILGPYEDAAARIFAMKRICHGMTGGSIFSMDAESKPRLKLYKEKRRGP